MNIGKEVRQGCCLSPILCNLHNESFGDFKIGGQILRTVKYVGDFVILAEEQTVLQGIFVRLTEIGRCSGVEMNVGKY